MPQGEGQVGLFKSTDAGGSWAPSAAGMIYFFGYYAAVENIEVDPLSSSIVYAGTEAGAYKSIDGGATWESIGDFNTGCFVAIDPSTPTTLYVGAGGAVYRSTDSGANWLPTGEFSGATVLGIIVDPTDSQVVYTVDSNGVSKSMDSGSSGRASRQFSRIQASGSSPWIR